MSVLGTGVAAGVAQVGLQAQSVARQRDRTTGQNVRDTARMQELLEAHMRALDESEFESPAQLHVDGQLPEHQSPDPRGRQHPHLKPAAPEAAPTAATPTPADGETPLYRHVDVQA